ncbi:hypothetical protein BDB01DRAFT_833929 [Pilobolus umbonatus]|nr:hypothetical protein BDB01DRAFT_833929 [Pilobolus umbonatus]
MSKAPNPTQLSLLIASEVGKLATAFTLHPESQIAIAIVVLIPVAYRLFKRPKINCVDGLIILTFLLQLVVHVIGLVGKVKADTPVATKLKAAKALLMIYSVFISLAYSVGLSILLRVSRQNKSVHGKYHMASLVIAAIGFAICITQIGLMGDIINSGLSNASTIVERIKTFKYLVVAFIPLYLIGLAVITNHIHALKTFIIFTLLMIVRPIATLAISLAQISNIQATQACYIIFNELTLDAALLLALFFNDRWTHKSVKVGVYKDEERSGKKVDDDQIELRSTA